MLGLVGGHGVQGQIEFKGAQGMRNREGVCLDKAIGGALLRSRMRCWKGCTGSTESSTSSSACRCSKGLSELSASTCAMHPVGCIQIIHMAGVRHDMLARQHVS